MPQSDFGSITGICVIFHFKRTLTSVACQNRLDAKWFFSVCYFWPLYKIAVEALGMPLSKRSIFVNLFTFSP